MPRRPTDEIDRIIGANIRRLRLEGGLTQQQLGHALGVSFQQIQKYEAGSNRIAAGDLIRIAVALSLSSERFWQDFFTPA